MWDQPGFARGQMGTQPGSWVAKVPWTRVASPAPWLSCLSTLPPPSLHFVLIVAKQHFFFFPLGKARKE